MALSVLCGAALPVTLGLVTDSVATKNRKPNNVKYLSVDKHMADAILRIHEGRPVSPLFKFDKNQD